jgi:transcriptional regulator with XRE-family HTH domain
MLMPSRTVTKRSRTRRATRKKFVVSLFEQLRLARGWKREALAEELGCSPKTIDKWDEGNRKPSAEFYPKLSEALRVNPLKMPLVFDKRFRGVALESIIAN